MDVRGLKNKKMCYYLGRVRGEPDSQAALSTCDGLVGKPRPLHRRPLTAPSPSWAT